MARVVIVDDEADYCHYVGLALRGDGHDVLSVPNGREAVDRGTRFRPNLLIADWMLRGSLHGVNVAYALQAVEPDLQSILITGYSSADVSTAAERAGICELVEKPFALDDIREALRRALASRRMRRPRWQQLAVACVDGQRRFVFANPRAREFVAPVAGSAPAHLSEVLAGDDHELLNRAAARWVQVQARAADAGAWYVRSQTPREDGTRLIVARRSNEPYYAGIQIVEMLLDVSEPRPTRWPFDGHVLVIDDDEESRGVLVAALEYAGATCFGHGSPDEGWSLFEADPGIRFVIWRIGPQIERIVGMVRRMRAARPGVVIVGTPSDYRLGDLSAVGVDLSLLKPWLIDELIASLRRLA
ncbi:MAG: response regulator [Phycisphaerae bacterium]